MVNLKELDALMRERHPEIEELCMMFSGDDPVSEAMRAAIKKETVEKARRLRWLSSGSSRCSSS